MKHALRLSWPDRLRRRCYFGLLRLFLRDAEVDLWRAVLDNRLAPQAAERVLVIGIDADVIAAVWAKRHPDTSFTAIPAAGCRQRAAMANLAVNDIGDGEHLPFAAATFDKVVAPLAFDHLTSQARTGLASELKRVLRRGGSLYALGFDEPKGPSDQVALNVLSVLFGKDENRQRRDKSWVAYLGGSGLIGVRYVASHTIPTARLALIRARRP